MKWTARLATGRFLAIVLLLACLPTVAAQELKPVTDDWALKIVHFDVGQADAAVVLTKDGHAAVIDLGEVKSHGAKIAQFLMKKSQNGMGIIETPEYLFISHYDKDHIGGATGLAGWVTFRAAYDQGPSVKRAIYSNKKKKTLSSYGKYVKLVGDPNGNGVKDSKEKKFIRHRAEPEEVLKLGNEVEVFILSVRGDTKGTAHDDDLDPSDEDIDENPGSMMLLIRFREFEYLTTGDATCADWRKRPDTENNLIRAKAIRDGDDVDVLKVSHHGSDTSTGKVFIQSTKPEVAIISSTETKTNHDLPKKTCLMTLEKNGALTLITGKATKANGEYHDSKSKEDDDYEPNPKKVLDQRSTITVLVSSDGNRYTVRTEEGEPGEWTFSAVDPAH